MADKSLSQIRTDAPAGALTGSEPLETVQGGLSVATTVGDVAAYARKARVVSTVTAGTITPNADTDLVLAENIAAALTIANPAANPESRHGFVVEIKDNGTSRSLTWGSKYSPRYAALPAATTAGKWHRVAFEYRASDDKLYCVAASVQP